jgi:hypothetical protein
MTYLHNGVAFMNALLFLSIACFGLWMVFIRVRSWWKSRWVTYHGRDEELHDVHTFQNGYERQTYFDRPMGTRADDGVSVKSEAETNMTQGSMIGMPDEIESASLELYFDEVAHDRDIAEFLRRVSIRFCLEDRIVFTAAGIMFEPVINLPGGGPGAYTLQAFDEMHLADKVLQLTRHFTKKIDIRTLNSCSCFRVDVTPGREAKLHGPLTMRIGIKGIRWRLTDDPTFGPKTKRVRTRSPR